MARKITFQQAISEALLQEMERDESIVLMGEDIAGGSGTDGEMDAWGGVLGVTKGLWGKFGDRVLDTPISESAFIGTAIGAATAGLRPVAELMFVDFMGVCFDQIFNQAAKFRYMFGGRGGDAGRNPLHDRRGFPGSGSAFAMPLSGLHAYPRAKVRDPLDAIRRQGAADPGDPRRRPGHCFRAQVALYDRGGSTGGVLHDSRLEKPTMSAKAMTSRSLPWDGWSTWLPKPPKS